MADFGIAFSRIGADPAVISDYLPYQELNVLELPWEAVGSEVHEEARKRNRRILCGSIADARLSAMILSDDVDRKMRSSFAAQLRKAVAHLAEHDIHTATLDCAVSDILASSAAAELREFLLEIAPALIKHKFTLLLPYSIPSDHKPEDVMLLFRNTLIPNIKLNLNVFPWQLPPDCEPKSIAGRLGYETRVLTFRYDADCGHKLLPAHLKKWLTILPARTDVLLAPFSLRNRMLAAEAEHYSVLVREQLDKTELERYIGSELN